MVNEMNVPIVTSLKVDNGPHQSSRSKPTPPWRKPFLELLGLLDIIDDSKPTPNVDGQRLCFQPSNDLSEISKIFLSVSTPSSTQYDIDIKTIRTSDSDAVPPAVNELQEYANHVLRKIQIFRDRLLEHDVIKDTTSFLRVNLFTCPLCNRLLISCVECDDKVACPGPMCCGSLVIDCELCYVHKRMLCHACLEKNDTMPPLICCPMCQGWRCREDADWCAGLIIHPAVDTKELAELSHEGEWDCKTVVRSHPPKFSPCTFCTFYTLAQGWARCRNSVEDTEPDRCPSQTPLMTQFNLRAAYCPECLDQSPGNRCACELVWICDTCSAIRNKSAIDPFLASCPRCRVNYCVGLEECTDYIDLCRSCKAAVLCKDCQEEEELPTDNQTEAERSKQAILTAQCGFCTAWSCADCHASERGATCLSCFKWFCCNCLSNPEYDVIERCPFCDDHLCTSCGIDHQGCTGAMILRNVLPPRLRSF